MTQPTVTKQIQALEKEFDTVLLNKELMNITPTKNGRKLFEYALKVVEEEDKIYSNLKEESNEISGIIDIYASTLPADCIIPELITKFGKRYQNIIFNIKKIDSKKVIEFIEKGIVDFGFVGNIKKSNKLDYSEIIEDEIIIIANPSYKERIVDIEFLNKEKFILRENGSATLKTFEKYIKNLDISLNDLNIKVRCEDTALIKKMVTNNMGVSVISALAVQEELEKGELVAIRIKDIIMKRSIYFATRKNKYYSYKDYKFIEYVFSDKIKKII